MQTFLTSFIILIAALYLAKRWLPRGLLMRIAGKNVATKSSAGCGSCSSSCSSSFSSKGGCGKNDVEKKIVVTAWNRRE